MEFKQRTLMELADMICGNAKEGKSTPFRYRSSSYLTEFFRDCDTDYTHDGSTRNWWVAETLKKLLAEPHSDAATPPRTFSNAIKILMDPGDAVDEGPERPAALAALNVALSREGFEAFYAPDRLASAARMSERESGLCLRYAARIAGPSSGNDEGKNRGDHVTVIVTNN